MSGRSKSRSTLFLSRLRCTSTTFVSLARMAHEVVEQGKLLGCQVNSLTGPLNHPCGWVQREIGHS